MATTNLDRLQKLADSELPRNRLAALQDGLEELQGDLETLIEALSDWESAEDKDDRDSAKDGAASAASEFIHDLRLFGLLKEEGK